MAWAKRTATDFKDCLQQIHDFVTKAFEAGVVTPNGGNVGTGIVYGASSSENGVAETWTLTCTTPGGDGVAVFSVSGSVSGAQAAATSGVPYSIPEVSFTILNGDVDWSTSNPDSFTFLVAASTALWSVNESDFVSAQEHILLQGKGSGSDEISVGFRTQTNNTTYWNMEVSGFTGYDATKTYDNQPAKISKYACMSSVSFDFYIFMSGRSIRVVPVIGGTNYESMYAGWFLPNATVSQYGYPMFIGGSAATATQLISAISVSAHICYWKWLVNALYTGTAWQSISKFAPLQYSDFDEWRYDLDGNRVLFPATVLKADTIYGELEGVSYVTNSDSALTVEDVLNTGTEAHIIFQDVTRVGNLNVAAFDLIGDL